MAQICVQYMKTTGLVCQIPAQAISYHTEERAEAEEDKRRNRLG